MVIRNYALRGIREMGFDIQKRIKSLLLDVNTTTDTIDLPDDFVDYTKIGAVGSDGLVNDNNMNNTTDFISFHFK